MTTIEARGYTNLREYYIIALRRSGHHALINWILRQSHGRGCFLNNCNPRFNPFVSCAEHDSLLEGLDIAAECRGQLSRKDYVVYNYEDRPLAAVSGPEFVSRRRRWLGASRTRYQLLLHRDAFNLIASKLRWAHGKIARPSVANMRRLPSLWKEYAREFLGFTRILKPTICISYNRWVTDEAYRRALAGKLELDFTDAGIEEVARWGPTTWGDSFDGLDYDGRAQEMGVLERWRIYADDPLYRTLVSDPELVELSHAIFGHVAGTEGLFERGIQGRSSGNANVFDLRYAGTGSCADGKVTGLGDGGDGSMQAK